MFLSLKINLFLILVLLHCIVTATKLVFKDHYYKPLYFPSKTFHRPPDADWNGNVGDGSGSSNHVVLKAS